MRTRPRRFLALLLPAALVLSFTSTPGTADTGPGQATGWRVSAEPFRLTFLDRGRPVTAEAPGAVAGPGGRLAGRGGGWVPGGGGRRPARGGRAPPGSPP